MKKIIALLFMVLISSGVSLFALNLLSASATKRSAMAEDVLSYTLDSAEHEKSDMNRAVYVLGGARQHALYSVISMMILSAGNASLFALMLWMCKNEKWCRQKSPVPVFTTSVTRGSGSSVQRFTVMSRFVIFGIILTCLGFVWVVWFHFIHLASVMKTAEMSHASALWIVKSHIATLWESAGIVITANICTNCFVIALDVCIAVFALLVLRTQRRLEQNAI